MSGYKHATVTISREEYQRLHEADMKKKFKEYSKIRSQETGRDEMVLSLIQQLEERERQLQAVLASSGNYESGMDDSLIQTLMEQNASYYQHLIFSLRSTSQELFSSVENLETEFSRILQIERENNSQYLHSVIQAQEVWDNREYAKETAAQQWLSQAAYMAQFIQSQFDHEKFAAGRLQKIVRNLTYAEDNLAQGFSESCLQVSQQMYIELSDLHLELEELLVLWQTSFTSTYSAVNAMIEQMSSNSDIRALGLKGEELPNFVNLDYWTNGKYHQLLEHCQQLAIYMYQDQNILSFEDVERISTQILPAMRESFETIIFEARLSALNSQLRMNIAEKALQALENHGFVLDAAGYTDDDMRSQFNAQLECPDGSQVSIQVLPTEKSTVELSNELVVITTHPHLKTDHEARLQWEELSNTLSNYNLRVSRPEVIETVSSSPIELSANAQKTEHTFNRSER